MKQEIDIEELLRWTYQDQRADVVLNDPTLYDMGRTTISATAVVMERLKQKGMIDNHGTKGVILHPDAESVHEEVLKLNQEAMGIVVHHAKTSSRPDLMSSEDIDHLINDDPYGCQNLISFERTVYSTWWSSLVRLKENLNHVQDYVICGPEVDEQPWDKKVLAS